METLYRKVPYTENSREIRKILEDLGYSPLSFFQGKDFIYPVVSNRVNVHGSWKNYDYSTCNEKDLNFENVLDCRGNLKLFLDNLELPNPKNEVMKKENIYIDLSKCSVEQIKNIEKILKNRLEKIGYHTNNALINGVVLEDIYLYFSTSFQEWCLWPDKFKDRTELTYHQFIGFFESENEEKYAYTKEDMENAYRAGENNQTYYFKDSTVILPNTYEGVDG